MWNTFLKKLKLIATDAKLRNKILFVFGAILVFRLLATIPIPGVNETELARFLSGNQFFGLLNIFSGGGLSALSIVMLGVGPYITASIIMQLLTIMVPKLKALYHEEGQAGKMKFSQYSRMLTVPLAVLQAIAFLIILQQQSIIDPVNLFETITNVIVITAGSIFLMWIGELISEFGIGNGLSLIIFAGIVAGFPSALKQFFFTYDASQIPTIIVFIGLALIVTYAVVVITEAERPLPIAHSRTAAGGSSSVPTTYLPLRINQAGVMPIIFALSVLLLPQMLATFLAQVSNPIVQGGVRIINIVLQNQLWYGIIYFVLVVLFTFFYTAVTFEPDSIAKNLQRSGAFIPGVRPGDSTSKYVGDVVTRVTLVGSLFLGIIAVLPIIVQGFTGITSLTIGGTSLLIAVSVIVDLLKKTEGQITMREY